MSIQFAQLDALVAVVEQGTFEAAARRLRVTPSAISQRIKALESSAGQVLVQRTTPCQATPAGETLLRLARQIRLLHDEADRALGGEREVIDLPVVVNADTLATWFRPVLAEVADWAGAALRLHVEDQAFSADLLRRGEVLAAVTSDPSPVQGCVVERLGTLRYTPAAAPEFAERWRHGRGYDWARMPAVVFNEKDRLQHEVLSARGVEAAPPVVHRVPTSHDFHEAVRAGLGWAVIPDPQLLPDLEAGRLVALAPRDCLDVELHWQRWRLASPALDRLTDLVRRAARSGLRRPAQAS